MPALSPVLATLASARRRALRALMALTCALHCASTAWAAGPTGLLNDTGQTTCYDGSAMVACNAANTGSAAAYPGQDARFGRDKAALPKIGGGAAGFDFTKVCMNGALNCAGAANTGASPASSEWACTKDNLTNLIWSLQTGQGDWTPYAQVTLPTATNAAGRCGFASGWRLPARRELLSIVHLGLPTGPMIDANYFPATPTYSYWTSDTVATEPVAAWTVIFNKGHTSYELKSNSNSVRLVRSGQ
ncbi:MAG: DUF1566 domain-containing protein [Comamonadaceae bacterium]|nr:DUF1566 domain-containing protein [Comamonadaceae bacterium]